MMMMMMMTLIHDDAGRARVVHFFEKVTLLLDTLLLHPCIWPTHVFVILGRWVLENNCDARCRNTLTTWPEVLC